MAALDVLAPGIGEIIGGAQREERLDVLEQPHGRTRNWMQRPLYLVPGFDGATARVPHAGVSASVSSVWSAYITGMANIRDVIPYPRVPGRADFLMDISLAGKHALVGGSSRGIGQAIAMELAFRRCHGHGGRENPAGSGGSAQKHYPERMKKPHELIVADFLPGRINWKNG